MENMHYNNTYLGMMDRKLMDILSVLVEQANNLIRTGRFELLTSGSEFKSISFYYDAETDGRFKSLGGCLKFSECVNFVLEVLITSEVDRQLLGDRIHDKVYYYLTHATSNKTQLTLNFLEDELQNLLREVCNLIVT